MSRSESKSGTEPRVRRASWRWTLGVVAASVGGATLAIAAVGATSARPAADVGHAVARCSAAKLVIWLDTAGSGAAGSTYYNIEFTNLGGSSCTLAGFPGVSAIGLNGAQIGLAAGRTDLVTAPAIDLAPGATSTAVLQLTDTGNFPTADCRQVTAAGLRVYAPNSTTAKTISYPFDACSLAKEVFLHVRPMERGVLPE